MPMEYAELHCLSNFSFLRGASHPEELVARAHALGYRALAVTDKCSVSGVVRAHEQATELGIQLIIGSELQLQDGPRLVLLVTDRADYGVLSQLITRARRRAPKGCIFCGGKTCNQGLGCLALLIPPRGLISCRTISSPGFKVFPGNVAGWPSSCCGTVMTRPGCNS